MARHTPPDPGHGKGERRPSIALGVPIAGVPARRCATRLCIDTCIHRPSARPRVPGASSSRCVQYAMQHKRMCAAMSTVVADTPGVTRVSGWTYTRSALDTGFRRSTQCAGICKRLWRNATLSSRVTPMRHPRDRLRIQMLSTPGEGRLNMRRMMSDMNSSC